MSGRTNLDDLLRAEVEAWPTGSSGVVVVDAAGEVGRGGDVTSVRPWASVTKILTALTVLRAVDSGVLALDEAAGPPGSTVRHLLAHASGLAVDSDKLLAAPGVRRVYSNRGFEVVAEHVAVRAGRPFAALLEEWVVEPLGLTGTTLVGSPAHGAVGPTTDLGRLGHEILAPTVLPPALIASGSTVAFPGLAGVLPGFGRQDPNDWGLGFEIRGSKAPHWTAADNSPSTFGHFGQAGSFLWVDPVAGLACACAGDTPFGPWSATAWPSLSARVLERMR